MDLGSLGDLGIVALALAALGLPVQLAIGLAVGGGRRVPVAVALFMPLLVLMLGLGSIVGDYSRLQLSLVDPADPTWVPWYLLYDRAAATAAAPMSGMLGFALCVPAMVGAAARGLRAEHRGVVGPLGAASGGLVSGVGLVLGGSLMGRPSLALPGLLLSLLALLTAGALAAVRPRHLSVAGIGVAGFIVATTGLGVAALGGLELELTDTLSDLNGAWQQVDAIAAHERLVRNVGLALLVAVLGAVATQLPGLGFIRSRDAGASQGLDIAASGALLGGALLSVTWCAVKRSMLGRLGGAHAAWVLAAGPGYDVPRIDALPPRVLVAGNETSTWIEMADGGGARRRTDSRALDEVGRELGKGDGVVLPRGATAEDLYLLLADAPAGHVSLVGCAPVPPGAAELLRTDPLLTVGRCGSFPLRLRVTGGLPDPRELILVPGPYVQDGLDVIDLAELRDTDGRDIVLRVQVDSTVPDLLAMLTKLRGAATVYLGWGVTVEGDALAIGVEPGLRVVERVPVPPVPAEVPGVAPSAPSAPPSDPASVLAAP
jgi:hypothetical protein